MKKTCMEGLCRPGDQNQTEYPFFLTPVDFDLGFVLFVIQFFLKSCLKISGVIICHKPSTLHQL